MKLTLLIALFWCVISQPLYAGQETSWLKFSGRTEANNDGLNGAIGVAANGLLGQNDAIGFDYRDAHSNRNGTDSRAATFRYRLPAGINRVQVEAGRSRYDHAVSDGGHRYNASRQSRVLGLRMSRPLFSRFGMSVDGIARHRGVNRESFQQQSQVSESNYQLSTFGLEASGGREIGTGTRVNTRILALSGREFQSTDYPVHRGVANETGFYKVAVSASAEQEFFDWNWRANGRYQFADEDLPSSEYLRVAGPSMLAGFNGQSRSVLRGGWMRLATASPPWPMPFFEGVLSSLKLAVLQGWIPYSGARAGSFGRASAGQVSLKMQGRAFTADLSVGRMISASDTSMTMPDHPDVRFSLSVGI